MAVAPLILAVVHHATSSYRAFLYGLASGAVYFGGTVYWTSGVMAMYGGISFPLASAIAGLLVAYLALFPGFFALALRRVYRRYGPRALWLAPLLWIASEFGRLAIFGGFPWVLLGYSQVSVLAVAQLASLTGVFGLSGLLVLVSTSLVWPTVTRGPRRVLAPALAALLVAAIAVWGAQRVEDGRLRLAGTPLRVGVVQGNVDQNMKWDPGRAEEIFARYLRLTGEAADAGARLVLWPESSTPFYFEHGEQSEMLRALARRRDIELLIGSDQYEQGRPPRTYNAAFLVTADGSTGGVYRKVHLVPFGEYVPAKNLLFFAKPLVEAVSDFAPGTEVNTLPTRAGRISTAICYEVVYPALIREGVTNGSALLTTITNDAWFGRSSAPSQHFAMAAMRAIEQGRYLVRAANTGISGVVDPYGRVEFASDLFVEGAWTRDVRLIDEKTPYGLYGDWVAWMGLAAALAALLLTVTNPDKKGTKAPS